MTEIKIEQTYGTEAQYDHEIDTILLGNWSKAFTCPYAQLETTPKNDDFVRLLHVLNHELLHALINKVADNRASHGLDWLISNKWLESWEGLP